MVIVKIIILKTAIIITSKSHYYIFSDTIDYYLIETKKLKTILSNIENKKIVSTKDKFPILKY